MSRTPEFLPLSDTAVRAVSGPSGRHAALIEDAFKVLIETPGGGVTITGDVKGRTGAKRALRDLSERADAGEDIVEADVRVAIGQVRTGRGAAPAGLPSGRRGQVAPKTPAHAAFVLPTEAAARMVADEWEAQGEFIQPGTMPATRLAATAIDPGWWLHPLDPLTKNLPIAAILIVLLRDAKP